MSSTPSPSSSWTDWQQWLATSQLTSNPLNVLLAALLAYLALPLLLPTSPRSLTPSLCEARAKNATKSPTWSSSSSSSHPRKQRHANGAAAAGVAASSSSSSSFSTGYAPVGAGGNAPHVTPTPSSAAANAAAPARADARRDPSSNVASRQRVTTKTPRRRTGAALAEATSYSFLPARHASVSVWKKYTPRTLAVFDGSGLLGAGGGAAGVPATTTTAARLVGGGRDGGGGATRSSAAARTNGAAAAASSVAASKLDEDAANRILLAIGGKVFDVTKGANFYGPGGPYGNFAGRDASRGMAKQSFDLDMLTPLDKPLDRLEDLTPMERANMREWEAHFTNKYKVVGELVNEGEQGDEG